MSLLGVIAGFAGLVLMYIGPTLAADARTPNLAGPGVDLFLRDPWPAPGATVRVEVQARGGSRAAVQQVRVQVEGVEVAQAEGHGVTWGNVITSGKGRADDTVAIVVPIPEDAAADTPITMRFAVDYVSALSAGAGSFANERLHAEIVLPVVPRTAEGAVRARLRGALPCLALLAAWTLVCRVAWRLVPRMDVGDQEMLGITCLMGFIGAGIVGYWWCAWPLARVLGGGEWPLTAAYAMGPLVWLWWSDRARRSKRAW
ncbi:MAG: hypothetical protein Q8P18_24490 [Pseudomonadota bacterium]|nr:hypothetical protein [Pseudomonadota bacterium]